MVDVVELQQSAHMTLAERCHRLRVLYGIEIGKMSLRHIYLRYGIRYRSVDYRMLSKTAKAAQIQVQQAEFVKKILQHQRCGKRIYWLDRTSVNLWMK